MRIKLGTLLLKIKGCWFIEKWSKVTIQTTNPTTSSTNSITGTVGETLNDKMLIH